MAEKKKMNKGIIACICVVVVAAIAAIVAVIVINVTKPNIVGKYNMTSVLDSEGNESADAFEMMKVMGMTYAIEFKDDKTGVFKVIVDSDKMGSLVNTLANALTDGETEVDSSEVSSKIPGETNINFTYDDKKITLSPSELGSSVEMNYEIKDGAVIVDYNSQKMKFTKENK